jgi:uroporphyrinogen decarboxylase
VVPRSEKPLLRALGGEALACPPVWLMRQAGRYLPEYRAVRAHVGGFLDLCNAPALAAEVTLQPVRRFGFDAAILFSDILVVPQALGQPLEFLEGEGPKLDPITNTAGLARLSIDGLEDRLSPVYETVRRVKAELPDGVALIGFSGAPWTLACYMAEGGGSKDFAAVKRWAYADPAGFGALVDLLTEAVIGHLSRQIVAGAEAVQLFDSWAGVLAEEAFTRYVTVPARRIAEALHARHPGVPLIGFPRGAGLMIASYADNTGVDALALDTTVPLGWAARTLTVPLQGNLDPVCLLAGGEALRNGVRAIRRAYAGRAAVFNLGHGVLPRTPPEHVAELVRVLREEIA